MFLIKWTGQLIEAANIHVMVEDETVGPEILFLENEWTIHLLKVQCLKTDSHRQNQTRCDLQMRWLHEFWPHP